MPHQLAVSNTASAGMVNLDKHGYTVHEDFLSADELVALRERLEEQAELEQAEGVALLSSSGHTGSDRYIGSPKRGEHIAWQEVKFLPNKGRAFLDLLHKPVIHEYANHLLRGEPYNVATYSGVFVRKGGSRQTMHCDQQVVPVPLDRPIMFVMMICLSDFEAEMGATLVAPGSHTWPAPDIQGDPDEQCRKIGSELVPLEAKAGSALFWEGRTWHCAGGSTSDKTRVSLGIGWAPHFVKPQEFYPAVLQDDVYETISDADKQMLGFNVIHGSSGAIAPRSPADKRTNHNIRYPYVPELRVGGTKHAVPMANMGATSD
jgi:ectoine hydroxylase-related dioxygenase (phytanoyl-CoA dioxygenase family)